MKQRWICTTRGIVRGAHVRTHANKNCGATKMHLSTVPTGAVRAATGTEVQAHPRCRKCG
jgi:hypothetical protein